MTKFHVLHFRPDVPVIAVKKQTNKLNTPDLSPIQSVYGTYRNFYHTMGNVSITEEI